jgi:branched-chain amino acid aminotransferase
MTIPIQILKPDGSLTGSSLTANSLEELGRIEPPGVYTITRTFHHDQVIMMDAHLDRLEESARLDGFPFELDRNILRQALRAMIARSVYPDARIRISVQKERPTAIMLALEPLQVVPEGYREHGVAVSTSDAIRPNPRVKSTIWVNMRAAARANLPAHAYEGIVLGGEQQLLEGFSSNIYGIIGGVLRTSDQDVLEGIARKIVFLVAAGIIPIQLDPIRYGEIKDLEESFLSSSGRGVVPIIHVDDTRIGDGEPGPLTKEIMARYDAWVEANLEPI